MTLVVDSSVAVKWFAPEHGQQAALALLDGEEELVAPDLLLAEVANALWRKARTGELSLKQIDTALAELGTTVTSIPVTSQLVREAMTLAAHLQHSVYDCIFLACAKRLCGLLITADAKLLAKLAGNSEQKHVRNLLA